MIKEIFQRINCYEGKSCFTGVCFKRGRWRDTGILFYVLQNIFWNKINSLLNSILISIYWELIIFTKNCHVYCMKKKKKDCKLNFIDIFIFQNFLLLNKSEYKVISWDIIFLSWNYKVRCIYKKVYIFLSKGFYQWFQF